VLLYRTFAYDPDAKPGEPGHPDYLHPVQGSGRWDNPDIYMGWYLAGDAAATVGEVFGDLSSWDDAMFDAPFLPTGRRALGTYAVPDSIPLLDLDNATALADRSLRPTQIVSPNRPATQQIARSIAEERDSAGDPLWDGLTWWSSRRSYWPVHFIWGQQPVCVNVENLDIDHHAVKDAAAALAKQIQHAR
jgi:hypothetical protein